MKKRIVTHGLVVHYACS